MTDLKNKNEDFWKNKLSPEKYKILRKKATEAPFTGEYLHNKDKGVYQCAACSNELFSSQTKFDSGSGWPSFWDVLQEGNVELKEDTSHGMVRTEVVCAKCGSHLGHLFEDGPKETDEGKPATGLRYCINSKALDFKRQEAKEN